MGPEDTRPAMFTSVGNLAYLVCIFVMSIAVTAAVLSPIIIHLRRRHAAEVEHYNAS